ncbi:hypothetical protein RND81_02G170000 [Saponaria officinalis]|uniref:Uncharacterized protein n=1 Tax=Saponaria officinalis TaxID=3572 RepID=A0AAW1MUW4_SAPOF
MKLIKSMKQLKFWSKTKKRKKFQQYHKLAYDHYIRPSFYNPPPPPNRPPPLPPPPPPPPEHHSSVCECHFCEVVEPSAPPLPPWLEIHERSYSGQESENWGDPILEVGESGLSKGRWMSVSEKETHESSLHERYSGQASDNWVEPFLEVGESGSSEDDRWMSVSEEKCGVVKRRGGGSGKLFGCIVDVGDFLFRCLFPCFRVSNHPKLSDKVV